MRGYPRFPRLTAVCVFDIGNALSLAVLLHDAAPHRGWLSAVLYGVELEWLACMRSLTPDRAERARGLAYEDWPENVHAHDA